MRKHGLIILIALVAAFTFGWALGTANVDHIFSDWLYRWQTIIAGIIALSGAAIGAAFLSKQINQEKNLEAQRRASRFYAIRSIMPLTLSALMGYVRGEVRILQNLGPNGELPSQMVDLPSDIVEVLKEFIEFADSAEAATTVRLMLSDIQIHRARMMADMPKSGHQTTLLTGIYVAGNIVRLVKIYAHIGALFNYARLKTDNVSSHVTLEEMENAAWNLAVTDVFGVKDLMKRDFFVEENAGNEA